MDIHSLSRGLHLTNTSKIVMLVSDGIGGLPLGPGGQTELETAATPNLDALAKKGVLGRTIPILPGITPGSGPGHLGLFGYDPLQYQIGRGALEAIGIGFDLGPDDVAVRGNFCTLDNEGRITDRRAGRIPTEESTKLVERLRSANVAGVQIFVEPVKEHRFVLVIRAKGLGDRVNDTDPQKTGVEPLDPIGDDEPSRATAAAAKEFFSQAKAILKDESKANGLTLRGFAKRPKIPPFSEVYGLRAVAIAVYPMYKGLARLVGMEILGKPQTLVEEIEVLERSWNDYDFFYVHFKYTDSTGEDGNFEGKVRRIEELDAVVPRIEALKPDVLIVTGDHSTPALMKGHSWHPVPTLLLSAVCRCDETQEYSERAARMGELGMFEAKYLMLLALAHAGRLNKYGA